MKIYVASSWRNQRQPAVVDALRADGHEVYDFKNPPGRAGFSWRELALGDPKTWTPGKWREALEHPAAIAGFDSDMGALRACDVCVLVLPCGRSAHLELGWAAGAGKRTYVLADVTLDEPELMVRMCHAIALGVEELRLLLKSRVHVLRSGVALCGAGMPFDWPVGDRWVDVGDARATCGGCIAEAARAR